MCMQVSAALIRIAGIFADGRTIITSRNPGMSCTLSLSTSIAACTYVRVLRISHPKHARVIQLDA